MMNTTTEDIVDRVIAVLRQNNQDPRTVKLEEAKQLTLQILRREKAQSRMLELAAQG